MQTSVRALVKRSVFETNYDRIIKLGIYQENGIQRGYGKSISKGYMDLVVERLHYMDRVTGSEGVAFSIAHYFSQNGDLCADPEMMILVHPKSKMVEALTFQQAIPPVYQEVYPEPGKLYPRLKTELNSFLRTWLNNLDAQGHGVMWVEEKDN